MADNAQKTTPTDGTNEPCQLTDVSKQRAPETLLDEMDSQEINIAYLTGTRFMAACVLLATMFFLVSMEISVVTTALVIIADDLGGFDSASWVLSSYLLGYVSVVVIFSKFSDIFGRKALLLFGIAIFTVFSGGCGAAQSMTQLIVLRAFQGIGGGGCFAMNIIFMIELVSPHRYSSFVAIMGVPIALALGLGPVIGGAISSRTSWRWVFLMNVPIGSAAFVLTMLAIPKGFPYHEDEKHKNKNLQDFFHKTELSKLDIPGTVLLLIATISLTAGFEEAGSAFPWKSAYVIALLTIAGILWIALLIWERRVTLSGGVRQPVLPWRSVQSRGLIGILLGSFLLGGPMKITLFQLPQRFQLVNSLSGLDAGVRLVPFAVTVPVGSIIGSAAAGHPKVALVHVALFGAVLQIIGFALLSTLPSTQAIQPKVYGFQVLSGLGCGASYQSLYLLIPLVTEACDKAVGMGVVTQFRFMGAAVILAIATSVFNGQVLPPLDKLGISSTDSTNKLSQSMLATLTGDTERNVRSVLSDGYNSQMLVLCISAGTQCLVLLLLWRKNQVYLPQKK